MINITRGEKPKSLDNPKIKQYLDDLVVYLDYLKLDDESRKLQTKPKEPDAGTYRNFDVLEAFDRDFYSKCYLTEQKYATSWATDIEHFKSKSFDQSPALKYEWTNLYPCSHDANLLKPKIDPIEGYLDPCDPDENVEKEIIYTLGEDGFSFFDVLDEENVKALNTVKLLSKVHNGDDYNSEKKTYELRNLISKKAEKVKEYIMEWQNAIIKNSKEDEIRAVRKIKNILSRKSDFTMLLRSLSCVKLYIPKEFLD